jgi:hypothetical protein
MIIDDYFVESDPYVMTDSKGMEVKVVDLDPSDGGTRRTPSGRFIFRIPLPWNQRATIECPGALQVANLLWYRAGLTKSRTVTLSSALLDSHGISRWTKYRSLRALDQAELVTLENSIGRTTRITILDIVENGE